MWCKALYLSLTERLRQKRIPFCEMYDTVPQNSEAVFIIAASVVTRATIGGVIEQYNIPLSEWTTSMYVIQSSMIFVYSLVFTVLLAIPLGIYFLGGEEQ